MLVSSLDACIKKCIQAGLRVTHELIAEAVRLVDPDGVELRKRRKFIRRRYNAKGPNSVWHIDSYDKLKPYGMHESLHVLMITQETYYGQKLISQTVIQQLLLPIS